MYFILVINTSYYMSLRLMYTWNIGLFRYTMALTRVFGVVKVVLAKIWLLFAYGVAAEAVEVAAEAEDLVGEGYYRKFPGQVTQMLTNSCFFQAYYEDNPSEIFVAPQCNTTNPDIKTDQEPIL
ncbi:uncharacterized protein LOC123535650 [Mercenaria mercenaria]|uniref:uncharacterized protein LOC123535650 n=1 Tax=Mercenaria mercenaria TaxID=6596 RepID=UPI00234F7FD1|nr:uncharacterized protein LOC123535650 [Mercenaria mercenaria]